MATIVNSYYEELYNTASSAVELEEVDYNYTLNGALFTINNVYEGIKHCNFNKGIGPDMFDGSVLTDTDVKQIVGEFVLQSLNIDKVPEYLRRFRLSLLSKTKSLEASVEDTRPIVIGGHLLKIVEKND